MAAGALPFLRRVADDGVGAWGVGGCGFGVRGGCATRCLLDRRAEVVGSAMVGGEFGLASFLRFRELDWVWVRAAVAIGVVVVVGDAAGLAAARLDKAAWLAA